jgi:uncharacterized membrane protein
MKAYWTWIGAVIIVGAAVFLVLAPLDKKTVPLLAVAVGAALIAQDERLKWFAARFPRWFGAVLMAVGFALAYFGAWLFGPHNYAGIMGGALSLLFVGWVLLRRGA